ncbi:MAG: hypothetical protein FJW36_06075 [Acidobacteria bacterium]|nr:hypothetical protein [Acidobacteriota bacterium]
MDDLQFNQAEYSGPAAAGPCANCGKGISDEYWHANGQTVCPVCAQLMADIQQAPSSQLLSKTALCAAGAAIGCSIAYAAILIITRYDLALIAIAVGWLIGKATRIATAGVGGRTAQYIAVAATYISISGTLFFQILYVASQSGKSIPTVFGYVHLFIVSMGRPFFDIQEGFQGIIGLVILFFGLQQAWQQTRAINVSLAGPYSVPVNPSN